MLDWRAQIRQYGSVKKSCTIALVLQAALALLSACKPQETNTAALKAIQNRNAELSREIADMQNTIRRVGSMDPGLPERLDSLIKEEVQAIERYTELKEQEEAAHMRRIDLEGRLDAFRSTVRELQSKVVSTSTPQP